MREEYGYSIDKLIGEYDGYLCDCCGASERTRLRYTSHAKTFLQERFGSSTPDLGKLAVADVIRFVTERAARYKPKTTKLAATAIRSFLRFLCITGRCNERLVSAVPTIPSFRLSSIPTSLSDEQLTRLLQCIDRSKPVGCRDYAMIQCMAGLGLRAGEVARLSLDDIDWRSAILRIPTSKARRFDELPLVDDVGKGIADYLRNGRPQTDVRQVFVQHMFSIGSGLSSSAVSCAVRRAFNRTDFDLPAKGAHVLRHTLGARMVRKGVSIKAIADVLRHRHIDTSMIYTKVDLPRLREVALPWPEAY
jgi:site-specific recombinase XerD